MFTYVSTLETQDVRETQDANKIGQGLHVKMVFIS